MYVYPTSGCTDTAYQTVTVKSVPAITFNQPAPVCQDADPIDLSLYVAPSGGTFTNSLGNSIGHTFKPDSAGVGNHVIRYTYSDGTCSGYLERTITVNPVPVIVISGLSMTQCDYTPAYNFTYSPSAGGTGTLTGDGVTDLGAGNANFNPATAGLGYHDVQYTFTTALGCTSTKLIENVRVGTDIRLTGLAANYCANQPTVTFNYSHWDPDPLTAPALPHTIELYDLSNVLIPGGVIDLGGGVAQFNPSVGVGNYKLVYSYTDDLTCLNTITFNVNVLPTPNANFSGLDASYCFGSGDITLTGMPNIVNPYTESGIFTSTTPAGSLLDHGDGTATLKPSLIATTGSYTVTYTFQGSSGCSDSETKTFVLNPLPVAYNVTGSGSYCETTNGLPVTLLNSQTDVDYQLLKNGLPDGGAQPGATGNPINWNNRKEGIYTVSATSTTTTCTNNMIGSVAIVENPSVVITTAPVSATVCQGGSVTFTIEASGTSPTYQWYRNGVALTNGTFAGVEIQGATSNILIINNVAPGYHNSDIYCAVTSSCGGTINSNTVKLNVNATTTVSMPPADATKCTGTSHTFTVVATGSGNTYVWKRGATTLNNPAKYLNFDTNAITILDITTADAGTYTCYIQGDCGVQVQTAAVLLVDEPIVITTQPVSIANACLGSNVAFNVVASGTNLAYQWYKNGVNMGVGYQSSSLAINSIAAGDAASYYCVVSSPCGASVQTNTVTLSTLPATSITTPPAADAVCELSTKIFTVVATGDNLQYEWYLGGSQLTDGGVVSNASTANLTLTGVTQAYAGNYRVKVSGTCGTVWSDAVAFTVDKGITVATQPTSKEVCVNGAVTFSVDATGDNLTYQWQKVVGAPIDPALTINTKDLNIPVVDASHAGSYRCLMSSATCGTLYSAEVTLAVQSNIAITPLSDKTVCEGDVNIPFSVVPSGTVTSYKWFNAGVEIAGATGATYLLPQALAALNGNLFTVTATGLCNSVSSSALLNVSNPVSIVQQPVSKTICSGTSTELSVSHNALSGTPTYQWYRNGGTVGSNSPVHNTSLAGSYNVTITNGCGTVSSNNATVSLVNSFNFTAQPAAQTVCEGGIATFTVAVDQPGVTYQWMKGGVDIAGATSATLVISAVSTADNGVYSCRVTNSCGSLVSNGAQLTVASTTISINTQPQSKVGCVGSPFSLNIAASTATGEPLSYEWFKGGVPVGTGNSFSVGSFAAGDAGTYYCMVSNGCTTKPSDNAVVTVGEVGVANAPASLNLCVGSDATFTVGALNPNFTYQWTKDHVAITDGGRISGTTTNILSITGVQKSDIATYNCIVTGTCGLPVTSPGAVLSIQSPPEIDNAKGPKAVTACLGDDATFSVVASGDGLTYQWQRNNLDIDPIGNTTADESTLIIDNVAAGDAAVYRCIVSNVTCGFVTSTSVELTILPTVTIVNQPMNVTACASSNVTFTFNITGPAGATYQWYKGVAALSNDTRVSGVKLATLTINAVTDADAGSYWCEVTSPCGNVQSNPATLTVQQPMAITLHPPGQTVCLGSTMNLSIQATGTITTYQWYFDNGLGGGYVPVGANSATYSKAFTSTDDGKYYCRVTNTCGWVDSDVATITEGVATTAAISGDVAGCAGSNANFAVTATGSSLSYQWYKGVDPLADDARITGSTSAILNITGMQASDDGIYTCYVSGTCGSTSVDARLTVSSAVSIATNPADRAVCVGGQVSFFVVVTGSNASFQWYKVGTGPIVGATSASYTINPVGVSHAGQYYCVVTNSCGSVTSTQANLTVYENVSIASHPQDVAACSGDNVSFSVTTTGTVLTYQWLFKGTPISDGGGIAGTNTQNLLISNVAKANEGAYSCEVYNGCTTITSNGATLTVSAPISILQHPQSQFACPGSAVNLVAVASGDYITYAWYRNSILQVGYTSSTYSIGSFAVGDAGDYYAVLTNGCGTVQTTTATLTAGVATSVAISGNLTKCEGTDAIFSVTGTGSNLSYQWYRGGTELVDGSDITGSNTATLTVKSIDAADGGTYQCDVSGSCGNYNNLFATLTVQKNVVIEVQPVSTSVVVNNSITLRVVASGEIVGYRWRKNGVDMVDGGHYSGTATANLTISNAENSDQATYTCAIDGVCNDLVSNSATLSVIAAKSITQQPMASVTKCEGETLVLAVEPSTGFTYKWKRGNNELSDDGRISGANSSTLTITNLTTTDQGAYTCVVGTEVSQPSVVTVNPSVYITSNPNDAGKCEGDSHILSVVATGNVLSYQWQKSPDGIAAFTNIAGETGREYSINPLAITHSGFYRCEVTGTCGSLPVTLNSSVAQLSVFDTIVINSQPPANVSVCQNGTTSITFDVSGYNPTFTWTKNGVAITDANITGINTNRIDISNAVPGNAGVYNCIVTSACGSQVISISSTLTVNPTTTITTQPIGRTKCEGDGVVFTVVAEGGSLSYDWLRDGASLGVNTATLSINNLDKTTHEGIYRCEVTGTCGSATSNSAVLAVNRATAITLPTTPQSQSICQNTSITMAVAATGDNLVYQWYKNGIALSNGGNISGVTHSELSISNALTADAGVYTCTVIGACGSAQTSPPITLTVNPTTAITTQPIGRTKCEGDGVVFTVVAEGGSLSYDWLRDGASLGVSTATLSINNLDKATHEGSYQCVVTGACGSASSIAAVLAINRATVITSPTTPQSQSICQNSSITLAVGATGDNLAYQWYRNGVALTDGGNISGVTLSELNISNALTADAGVYTCTVTGACGSAQASPPITLAVTPTTTITTQPIGRTKCEGDGVVFTVVAEGGSLSYDWQRDGASLGVSTATLSINSLDKATHEGTYRCEVTGACGSATSNSAVLAVNRATAITSPTTPQSQSICQNTSITLAVGATGDNLAYQWYRNGVALTDGGNISGVTLSELNISNALTADAGVYTCTVTGACGSVQASPPITLAVTPTTTITTQPIGRTKCEGDGVVFTVVAEGGSLSYDWQRDGASLGVNAATLSINSLDKATHEGTYRCEVTGACGSATSNSASLIVYELVSITSEPPALTTICQGASTEITVEASGSGLMYQWKRNGVNLSDGGNLSGVTSNKLVISNAVTTDAGFYSCEIVGSCNTVSTQSAELRVIPTTSIALHPVGATLCEGDNVQFIVNAVGASPLTYQWKRDNVNIGANTNTLTLNGITTADAGAYICVVTGATCGSATSNPATLVVNPQITISGQPANIDVCEDNTAIFTVNATGTGTLGYKWLLNNAYLTDNGRVTGSATNQLSVNLASAADEGIYKCEIASTCGSKTSNSVTLAVTDSTQIAIHPLSQTLLQGSAANFSVFATGANLSYQWQKDNVDIPGAQSNAYSITSVLPAHAGQYRCVVRGTCGQVISNMAVLTVTQPVSITTNPLPSTVCAGQSASFTIAATGTVISYQWKFNGNNITDGGVVSGAATANLVISSASSSHSGTYSCVVTGSNNIANSSVATLSVNSVAAITTQPLTQTKCNGDMLVLEVLPNDPTLAYSWELNGSALPADPRITGVNSNLLVITGVSSTDAGSYRCTVSNSCGSELSDPAVVTISPVVSVTNHPSSMVGCEGQTASFTVSSNLPAVNYLWTKNGQPLTNSTRITGVDQANLTIYNISTNDAGYYSCRISDNCSYDNSDVALLEVKKKTTIQSHPVDRVVCRGDIAYFEVNATGTDLGYQWQKNGANIPADVPGYISGSKSNVLIITGVTDTDVGVYRCVITGGCNDELTTPASLTVNEYPSAAGSISGLTTVCQGDGNVLYSIPAIANANTYVWDVPYGASIVGGQGSRAIQVDFAGNALSGVVKVHGLNSCGVGPQSAPLAVTVNTRPTAFAGIDQTVCGYSTTLEANSVAGTWSIRNGDGIFTDSSLFNTNVSNLLIGENTFVWTVTQNGCTSSDEVKITNLKVNINAGNDQIICSRETNLQAIVPATGASWRVINGYGTIESPNLPNSRITGLNQGSNTFAWQVNNQGCFTSDEVVITNNSPLRPEAGEDQIIAFDETDLNADMPEAGTIGYWELLSGGGSFVDATDPKTRIVDLMPGTNILVWTVKREGCTLSDTIIVENILLEPAEAGLSQTLCVDFTTLNAKRPEIGEGQWSVFLGQASFDDIKKPNAKVTSLGRDVNILRWTVRTSTLGVTYDDVIIINNMPTQANAGIDQVLCTNSTSLAANSPAVGTGYWTLNSGAGTIADTSLYNSAITSLGPGKNVLKWTIDYKGCISEDYVTITNSVPTTANAGDDQTICYDSTLLFPNTPTYGVGSWRVETGRGLFNGNSVTNLAPGINTFVYTITNGTCTSVDRVNVINNKPTSPDAGYDQVVCLNSCQLTGNPVTEGNGTWSVINGSGSFSDLTSNTPTVIGLSFGDNIFRWTIENNGCTEHDEVIVSYSFVAATAGLDETLCQDYTQLRASNPSPGTGTWSILEASTAVFDNQNSPNTTVRNLSKGPNNFRWTVINRGCVSYDDVTITNNQPTQAIAGENQAVCSKSASLFANRADFGVGVWSAMSGSASFTDAYDNRTTVNNLNGGPNVLRWTITQGTCVSYDEVIITSNLPVNVFAGNDQVACSDMAVLSANPPTLGTGQWTIISGAGSFDNRTLYNTTVRNLAQGDNYFKWTVSSSDCHVSDTVVIRSSIPTRSIAGADQIICSETTTLGGNTPTNGSGFWTVVSGSVQFVDRTQPNTQATSIARGLNILAWVIDKDGCQSSSEMRITNNLPSTPFAGYDRDLCGDSIRLFANPPTIGTGHWTIVSGDASILSPNQNQTLVKNIKFGPNTFRWTVTHLNCQLFDDVVITSNYAEVNAGVDMEVNEPTVQLIGNKPALGIGTWSLSAGQGTIISPNNFETLVNGLGAGVNIFVWSINYNGCVASDAVTVNYIVWPIPDFDPSTLTGCSPLEVNFVNTTTYGGAPFSWDFGDGSTSNQTNVIHTFQEPGIYNVRLTATAPLGNTVSKEKTITVYGHPTASFDIAPRSVFVPGQHISCYNYSINASVSIWDFGDGTTIEKFAPTYVYTDTGWFDIMLKVINSYGCADSLTIAKAVHVVKRSDFFFPEAFTPNPSASSGGLYDPKDRSNDVFFPIVINGDLTDYELRIYNRTGVLIFKSNDVKIGWDGYYKSKIQPQDVYIYVATGRYNSGEAFRKAGNVLLIRKDR